MNNTTTSFKSLALKNTVIFNPVLVQLIGICPIVGASTSMFSSVLLTVLLTLVLCLTSLVASVALKKVSRWLRVALYLIIGAAIICPVQFALEMLSVELELSTKIFLPLLAISSLTAVHCEQVSVKNPVKASLADSFALSIGYGVVFLITGFFRELLGKGTLFGIETAMPKVPGMLLPFGGLIVLAYLAVALRAYVNKFHPQFADESLIKIKRESLKIREAEQEAPVEEKPTEPEAVRVNEEPQQIELFSEFWEDAERPAPKPKKKITIEKPSLSSPVKREEYVAENVEINKEEINPPETDAQAPTQTAPQIPVEPEAPVQKAPAAEESVPETKTSASEDYFSSISQGFDDLIRSIEADTFTAKNKNNTQENGKE